MRPSYAKRQYKKRGEGGERTSTSNGPQLDVPRDFVGTEYGRTERRGVPVKLRGYADQ